MWEERQGEEKTQGRKKKKKTIACEGRKRRGRTVGGWMHPWVTEAVFCGCWCAYE